MTVKERVLASRLIRKLDNRDDYAAKLGLSCKLTPKPIPKADPTKN